jgi:hypothetical protein
MKRLYAKFVLWMIRPALDSRRQDGRSAMCADAEREGVSMSFDAGLATLNSECEESTFRSRPAL